MASETTGPPIDPEWISTVTLPASVEVPLNEGLVFFDGDSRASKVTDGGAVTTSKVTALLKLVWSMSADSACSATAV